MNGLFKHGSITIPWLQLAEAWGIPEARIAEHYRSGRASHQQLQDKLMSEVLGWCLEPIFDTKGFDFTSPIGEKWEAKSMSAKGVELTPSSLRGAGRKFDEKRYNEYVASLYGFVIFDMATFPDIEFTMVTSALVAAWERRGLIKRGHGERDDMRREFNRLLRNERTGSSA